MGRIDRYMLLQMLTLFGFFSLVLALIFWIDRAVQILDSLMGDGQTLAVFLQITLLSLPAILSNLLPIAAFAATVYVTNKLSNEAELVVVQAAGYSPYRLARATLYFGGIVMGVMLLLTHILVPLSQHDLNVRNKQIAADTTSRLFTEGTFIHPTEGVTFYAREITPANEFLDIYLSTTSEDGSQEVFLAERALIVNEDGAPRLVMFNGQNQQLPIGNSRLTVTDFESAAYGLGDFVKPAEFAPKWREHTTTLELIKTAIASDAPRHWAWSEIAARTNKSLQGLTVTLVGFAALLLGGFSRFGLWRQVFFAFVLLVLIKSIDNSIEGMVRQASHLWPLRFSASLAGIGCAYLILWKAAHPRLRGALA